MKEYIIYFELFGKKMKTVITADSEDEAKKELLSKVIFHKIEREQDFGEYLMNTFFGKKK